MVSPPPPGYPAYPPPGYGPPGYPGYPGYPPPGYGPPGYPGYPPPGYPPSGPPPALKPGVVPLRPLSLSDIFNGALGYIRTNPKTALGLTTVVVVAMQLVTLLVKIGPMAVINRSAMDPAADFSGSDLAVSSLTSLAGTIATVLGGILLSGMLTVVVGRAVFGSSISIAEAWTRVRGRLLPLIGLAALMGLGAVLLTGAVILPVVAAAAAGGPGAAVVLGVLLVPALIAAVVYLFTRLSFASPLIVLEGLGVFEAMGRSFALVRHSFWRVLGILLLTALVTSLVAGVVGAPFTIAGTVLTLSAGATTPPLGAVALSAVGSTIGQIITAPFSAGVIVLLYTDRRIRAEAFDLVLQTGAAGGPAAANATDSLWLTRPLIH